MNFPRAVISHVVLLALGGAAATFAWSREKTPHSADGGDVVVWSGRSQDLEQIVYESKGKKVTVEPKEEKKGDRWFMGTIEKETSAPPMAGDAGVAPPSNRSTTIFASTGPAKKLADALAPLKATRSMGKVDDARASEFGLDKKETTLTVKISGKEHKLVVGDSAPGGSDTYVLDTTTNEGYVMKADPLRDLDMADGRLLERDLHEWKDAEAKSATITAEGKTRKLVRGGPENRKFWADPANAEKADETAGNWMQKVGNIRALEYVAKPPEGRSPIVRVELAASSGSSLGFVELSKSPDPAQPQKFEYWVTSEHLHLYAKVYASVGEQVEQDLGSLLK
jgi:Domain of unknown function (DUF4340)